jgi:hypothetical protein
MISGSSVWHNITPLEGQGGGVKGREKKSDKGRARGRSGRGGRAVKQELARKVRA